MAAAITTSAAPIASTATAALKTCTLYNSHRLFRYFPGITFTRGRDEVSSECLFISSSWLHLHLLSGPVIGSSGAANTGAKAIVAASNSNVRPIPIDDLYFTRSVSNASWSPNGKEVVFTTDISGRSNLWKVNA